MESVFRIVEDHGIVSLDDLWVVPDFCVSYQYVPPVCSLDARSFFVFIGHFGLGRKVNPINLSSEQCCAALTMSHKAYISSLRGIFA